MHRIMDFLSDEHGAMTIDFILWLPLFVSLLVMVTDASILYLTQTEMWNVARDTARRMTTQHVTTTNEAKCWAISQLNLYSSLVYNVEATSTKQLNSVAISVPVVDASNFGYFLGAVLGNTISARVTMRADPTIKDSLPEGAACATSGGGGGGGGGGKGKPAA